MIGDSLFYGKNTLVATSIALLTVAVVCVVKARIVSEKDSVEKLYLEAKKVCEAINNGNKDALCFAQAQLKDDESPYHYLISLESDGQGWYSAHLTEEAGYVSRRAPLMGVLKEDVITK